MGRSRKEIMEQFPKIKQMYDNGCKVQTIAQALGVSKESIYNAFTINGISLKKSLIDESNLVYADNRVKFEKVVIYGKRYIDVTQEYAPR